MTRPRVKLPVVADNYATATHPERAALWPGQAPVGWGPWLSR